MKKYMRRYIPITLCLVLVTSEAAAQTSSISEWALHVSRESRARDSIRRSHWRHDHDARDSAAMAVAYERVMIDASILACLAKNLRWYAPIDSTGVAWSARQIRARFIADAYTYDSLSCAHLAYVERLPLDSVMACSADRLHQWTDPNGWFYDAYLRRADALIATHDADEQPARK